MQRLFFISITATLKTGAFPDSLCTTIYTNPPSTHHEDLIAISKEHPQKKTPSNNRILIYIIPALLISAYCANKFLNKNEPTI